MLILRLFRAFIQAFGNLWGIIVFAVATGGLSWYFFSLLDKYPPEPSVTFILFNFYPLSYVAFVGFFAGMMAGLFSALLSGILVTCDEYSTKIRVFLGAISLALLIFSLNLFISAIGLFFTIIILIIIVLLLVKISKK